MLHKRLPLVIQQNINSTRSVRKMLEQEREELMKDTHDTDDFILLCRTVRDLFNAEYRLIFAQDMIKHYLEKGGDPECGNNSDDESKTAGAND